MQCDLLLIDASSFIYRAFHAMPPLAIKLKDGSELATGAIRGFVHLLATLFEAVEFSQVVCVFDWPDKNFRHDIYPQYKATRAKKPPELKAQMKYIELLCSILGLPIIKVPGVEADDTIGTLATRAAAEGLFTIIASGDKDLCQLVNSSIVLIDTMRRTVRDELAVYNDFGVKPEQIQDYLSLVGDTADNIPGVDKVGSKTAARLLNKFGSLDNILNRIAEVQGSVGVKIDAHRDMFEITRQLVKIKTDCEIEGFESIKQYRTKGVDTPKLKRFLETLRIRKFPHELPLRLER